MRRRAAGMDDAFRNPFVIEVEDFFAQDEIFQQGGAALPALEAVLVVGDAYPLVGRKMSLGVAMWTALGRVLMRFAAVAGVGVEVVLGHGALLRDRNLNARGGRLVLLVLPSAGLPPY